MILFVLGVFRVPRTKWVLALAPLLFTYTCVTGARASAIRASAMMVAYLLAPLLKRRADSVTALALAATGILLWQPEQIIDMGFLYSFVVVAGIMAIVPIFDRALDAALQRDPLITSDVAEPWWRGPVVLFVRTLSVSLAAWLTSAPLSLHFFGHFSPVALLGNILAIPLAFLILVTGCLSMVIGSVSSWAGEVLNHANVFFVRTLVWGMQWLERIPLGWVECDPIPISVVIIWYTLLISGVVAWRQRHHQGGRGDQKTEHRAIAE